jgi:hypothetical protein
MEENNYNTIKPVEGLQNVGSLTPVQQRQERKKQQNPQEQKNKNELAEDTMNKSTEESVADETTENHQDQHSVDYCA